MKKVLVIDDSETTHERIRSLLVPKYQVLSAMDGIQGMMAAQNHKPDLILLDLKMPGGGGATIFERLRQSPATWDIPVMIHTEIDGVKAPSGTLGMLKKSTPPEQIVATIQRVLG